MIYIYLIFFFFSSFWVEIPFLVTDKSTKKKMGRSLFSHIRGGELHPFFIIKNNITKEEEEDKEKKKEILSIRRYHQQKERR